MPTVRRPPPRPARAVRRPPPRPATGPCDARARTPASDPLRLSARSYLHLCGDDTTVTAAGCIDKVTRAMAGRRARRARLQEAAGEDELDPARGRHEEPVHADPDQHRLSTLDTAPARRAPTSTPSPTGTASAAPTRASSSRRRSTRSTTRRSARGCARRSRTTTASSAPTSRGCGSTPRSRSTTTTAPRRRRRRRRRRPGLRPRTAPPTTPRPGSAPAHRRELHVQGSASSSRSGNKRLLRDQGRVVDGDRPDDLAGSADACSGTPADN